MELCSENELLTALIRDPAHVNFNADMQAVSVQLWMYIELCKARGQESTNNGFDQPEDLFWVTRSAIVTSFSALDRLVHALLQARLSEAGYNRLRYQTFQSAKQIDIVMRKVGMHEVLKDVAEQYSVDLMTEAKLRSNLDRFYKRKNRITHHADTNEAGKREELSIKFAHECYKLVWEFGTALHSVVFASNKSVNSDTRPDGPRAGYLKR